MLTAHRRENLGEPMHHMFRAIRRIVDETERQRLKEVVARVKPEGMGVIVRTAAEGMGEEDFAHELEILARLWNKIQQKADFVTAPHLIHAEETLLFRTVRDLFTEDVSKFVIYD